MFGTVVVLRGAQRAEAARRRCAGADVADEPRADDGNDASVRKHAGAAPRDARGRAAAAAIEGDGAVSTQSFFSSDWL